jgi:hypothetical protein
MATESHTVSATLNYYFDPAKGGYESFLFSTVGEKGRPFDHVDVRIADIRGSEEDFHLDTHGSQYVKGQSAEKVFEHHEIIKQVYYPECAALFHRAGSKEVSIRVRPAEEESLKLRTMN